MANINVRDEYGPEARGAVRAGFYDIVFALNLAFSLAYALPNSVIKRFGSSSS